MKQLGTNCRSCGRALSGGVLLLAWLTAHGCGDDEPEMYAKPPGRDGGEDSDASDRGGRGGRGGAGGRSGSAGDAGDGEAGSGGSSQAGRGGSDAVSGSGGSEGGAGDASVAPSDPCELTDDQNEFGTMDLAPPAILPYTDDGFAMATGTVGFGVAYQKDGCSGAIEAIAVKGSGEFAMPWTALDLCSSTRDMALLHTGQGWRMVWVDNHEGSAELQSMLLVENMMGNVGDLRTRVTENDLRESRPVLAEVGEGPLLAYIATSVNEEDATTKTRIASLVLDGQAPPQDVIGEDAERWPEALALTQISEDAAALAWVDERAKLGVWLQLTDLTGAPQGEPMLLTDVVSTGSTVDLAARPEGEGGAALYSIRVGGVNQEVRFRRLGEDGALVADEVKIVAAPQQGRDGSIARLGGGFVIAYRALPGGVITAPEIRLAFITPEGNIMKDAGGDLISYKVADAAESGGRVTVRVSTDGQLLIGFVDATAAGNELRLVRRRLDCPL
jgi:hypothetical protein